MKSMKKSSRLLLLSRIFALMCLCGGVFLYTRYIDWPAHPSPLPYTLEGVVEHDPSLITNFYSYYIPRFIDAEFLWRIEARPELIGLLTQELDLQKVDNRADVPDSFWRKPPHWWKPRQTAEVEFYRSADFEADKRGPDGSHYFLMYAKEESVIYVWLKYNF